jgi:hypothetical protein
MIGVVFVRRLRDGKTYDLFRWFVDADHDFQAAPHPVEGDARGHPWVTPAR